MAKFPKGVAGFNLNAPNKPLELTDIAYQHRSAHLRQSEEKYQGNFGEPFQCPTCRKHTYSSVEGGTDSPDCDSCWKIGEDIGLPKTRWEVAIPLKSASKDTHTDLTVKQVADHGWNSFIKGDPEIAERMGVDPDSLPETSLPKGPYRCAEPDQLSGGRKCGQKFNSTDEITQHWVNDPEHYDDWGKD